VRYIPDLGYPPKVPSEKIGPTDTFVVSADGSMVAGISAGDVLLFETRSWSLLRRLPTPPTPTHPDHAESVAISPSGRQVAIGTAFGYVHFFGADDGTRSLSFVAFPGDFGMVCGAITFSPDGRFLATGRGLVSVKENDDGWTRLWRVSDGAMVAGLTGGKGSVRAAAWNHSGDTLAVGDDRTLRLWRTTQLPQRPQLAMAKRDSSYSAAFSPNGTLAASDGSEIAIYH